MLFRLFSFFVNRPIFTIVGTFLIVAFLAQYSTKLEIDASSETLMLNNDKDLNFARDMAKRYKTPDFLIVTYSPNSPLLSQKSLGNLKSLTKKLEALPDINSTVSILNAPLLQSPVKPIKELVKALPTLQSKDINLTLVKKEFLTSPLYKNNLVSEDFKTTAIVLNLNDDKRYFSLLEKRNALLNKEQNGTISQKEKKDLVHVKEDFKTHRDKIRLQSHKNIKDIREILSQYKSEASLFLGGVGMIADDMITYVKSDILLYGSSLFVLLVLTLFGIFRQIRWVLIPIVICTASVLATTGILGLFGFEITVISSNFISLQLIITLSITLHLIVQYQEYAKKFKKASQKRLILTTLLAKANPSFFAIITTIAGFASLIFSNIKPIINLGFMMSLGISVSLVLSFILFASINSFFQRKYPKPKLASEYSITSISANLVLNHGNFIIISSLIIFFIGIFGATKLHVENSFINYFKSSTEIYKGMEVIDKKLGGTTPLDIIVTFKEAKTSEEEFDDFEQEFQDASDDAKYWFTRPKIELIQKISTYLKSKKEIGNTQSFDTVLTIGKTLNNNQDLDSFLIAILYNEMPNEFKSIILQPYVNVKNNQVRFNTRIIDSNPNLRRNDFIKKMNKDLSKIIPQDFATFKLSSFMILYNNMLQSLYKSQIVTLGFVILLLTLMFWILFRSLKVALIAIISNIIPMSLLFGFMGLAKIPLDMMSITIAAISIGIGVDDTIHYIHRFKHEYLHVKDYNQAMINSHKSIGYAMFYTSFAIVLGFSVLIVSNFIPTIYFGLLTVFVMIMVLFGALLLLPRLIIITKPF